MLRPARNIAIVLVIAALVDFVPGGGTAANVVTQALWLIFLAVLVWFASIIYRQNRFTLDALGDRRRTILYAAIGIAAVTLTAKDRLTTTGVGTVVWLVILGACVYAAVTVVIAARR